VACALAVLCGLGCDAPNREIQEWTPADHQEPEVPQEQAEAGGGGPSAAGEEAQIAAMAAEVWRRECASCHGTEGRGDGPSAPTAMPDLTTAAFHAEREDADLTRAIRMGQGLMPAFGGRFNETGIQALVAHVRSLRAQQP
jgi:mono/diheme cytochrome c family protein